MTHRRLRRAAVSSRSPSLLFSRESGKMGVGAENCAGKIMTRAEIEGIIRKLYAARVAEDIGAIMPFAAPDVEFVLSGDPGASPVAGRLRGADALRPQLETLFAVFKFHSYDIVTLVVEGSNAAVRAKASLTSTVTGQTVDMEFGDFFTFKDGRVASFVQFCDTALAGKLATRS
jgi:ketosteroid isomerase-like protein